MIVALSAWCWLGSVAAGFPVIAALPPIVDASPSPAALTPAAGIYLWQWSGARALNTGEAADLQTLPTEAFLQWVGSVDLANGQPTFARRGGSVRGLDTIARWSVIRIEVRCLALLGTPAAARLAEVVAQHLPPGSAGLQIDADVPVRRLADYGTFLADVHRQLPSGTGLSCTGLLSWLASPDLATALAEVDWWVPQCYSTSVPADPTRATRLAGGGDVARVVARCEALQRPFRIGLPTFEQVTWWNPDRTLHTAALSVALEDVLAAGLIPIPQFSNEERLVRFDLATDTVVGSAHLPAGSVLLTGQPTVTGLAERMHAARVAAGAWYRGVCLFRLPGEHDLPALSTAQLVAADRRQTSAAQLSWHWSGGPGAWELRLDNTGDDDLQAFTVPVRLAIAGRCEAPLAILPGGIRCQPARGGVPVAPAHADGLLVSIPFLRSGHAISLPPLALSDLHEPSCQLVTTEVAP